MDITLVINPGSSSKKYALFQNGKEILSILFEHTKGGYGKCVEVNGERQRCEEVSESTYEKALEEALQIAKSEGVMRDAREVTMVGVRIVAPGTYFGKHRVVTEDYFALLRASEAVAPLHIPHTLGELTALTRVLPGVPVVGVSDSAFHSTMPEYARRYSIPEGDAEAHDVYRFGYHGISVSSVVRTASELLGEVSRRTIVCHVGSGVSVTALKSGKSVDTTMGFAPGDGLVMGTRSGDLSTGALLYLMKVKEMSAVQAEEYVNSEGGFRGLLGQNDLRIVLDRMARGEASAKVAIEMFTYHVKQSIGSLAAVLGGLDLLILTATAVERNPTVRTLVCSGLEHLGVVLDYKANESLGGRSGSVSREDSRVKVLVLHTNEMLEIARATRETLHG
jgi:acetate kinase